LEKVEGEQLKDLEERVLNYDGPDRIISSEEYWEIHGDKPKIRKQLNTGIGKLDGLTEGVETGELVVFSGPTGNGKTLLADTIGRNFSHLGINVAWFSFEVLQEKFLEKYRHEGVKPIYIPLENKSGDPEWLKFKALEAKTKFGCQVMIIDHLHFIVDMATQRNMSLNIGAVMRSLKHDVAIKLNMAVILICHMDKNIEREPNESNIRDSSFISQEADQVFIIFRSLDSDWRKGMDEKFDEGRAKLIICKSRRTGAFRKVVPLIKQGNDLVEWI